MRTELAKSKGNHGSGLPYCWTTPDGHPVYMLHIELHDDDIIVSEVAPRPRPDDRAWGLVEGVPRGDPIFMLASLIFAQMGLSSISPTFWPLPTAMLTGTAAAGGIALINAVGNLGGFFGPYLMGFIQDATGSFQLGPLTLAMSTLVSAAVVVALGHNRQLERIPSSVEQDA